MRSNTGVTQNKFLLQYPESFVEEKEVKQKEEVKS